MTPIPDPHFKRIALLGRRRIYDIPATLLSLIDYLQSLSIEVVLEALTAELIPPTTLKIIPANELKNHAELLIAVGGDGSLIQAAHIALEQNLPVVGINRGRLGFLTDIYPDEFHKIDAILNGRFLEEKRTLLQMEIWHEGQQLQHDFAMNDVVLFASDAAHMSEFDIHINQKNVCNLRADGLILSSPTGSTAYALSAGGPIMHPALDTLLLVPMFPHTLSNRPLVMPGDSVVEITITEQNENTLFVSCDGQNRFELSKNSTLRITRLKQNLHLIHPEDYDYFKTLRSKLGWHNH